MKELIGIAALVASLYGGTVVGERIYQSIREAALTKAAIGLPSLSSFSHALTSKKSGQTHKAAPPKCNDCRI